jgi:hypothetical protein
VRDPKKLEKLSAEESTAWTKFWTDVAALRGKAASTPVAKKPKVGDNQGNSN